MEEINKRVWFENEGGETVEEIYISGTIKAIKGEKIVVATTEGKEYVIGKGQYWYCNPPILEGTDDLTSLSHMHEPAVLHNLKLRYMRNQIYSKSGPILIAVNPYQSLPIYSDALLAAYCGESARQLPPHVYAIGDQAFRAMVDYGKNQSILVTGESGAGKTETTKIILQYFATKGKKTDLSNVQDKVLESTPILEAFGNAKTLRNDNSSRFGKFIIVDFDSTGSIVGARLKTYLLEKSRLLRQVEGERNYHIFFEVLAACRNDPNILPSVREWNLKSAEEYNYLNTGGDLDLGKDESKHFLKTKKALEVIGLSIKEIDHICTILIGILALGNIKFNNNEKDSAIINPSSKEWLELCGKLLGLEPDVLLKSISSKAMTTGKESYVIPLNSVQAETARDSLAALLYETLFLWLVERINESMATKEGNAKYFIGILDIYGFESFKVNSFEQFCINYANEKLQQQFNQHMFKIEQEEYQKEEIDWTYVKFSDNQLCIALIEKHLGILSILNEESKFPKSTPQTFATKLVQKNSNHPYFEKSPFHDHGFIVKHYPGRVEYDTSFFLEKNRNMSLTEYISILQNAKNEWMRELFVQKSKSLAKSDGGNAVTISTQFKDSLQLLMDTIHQTEANYIRCIKPNNNKKPLEFGQRQVLDQLRCNGVLEAIRIARDGFPTRYLYPTFWFRFKLLVDMGLTTDQVKTPEDHANAVKKLMQALASKHKLEMYQFGKTKLFLKGGQLAFLEDLRTKKRNDAATVIQKFIKRSIEMFKFNRCLAAANILQAISRMKVSFRTADELRKKKSSTVLQRYIRMWNQRTAFIQKLMRENSATTLQKHVRTWFVADAFNCARAKVITVQARWRGVIARKQYHKLKQEALKAANLLQQNRVLLARIQDLEAELLEKSATLTKVTVEESAKNEAEKQILKAKMESYEAEIESKNEAISRLEQNDAKAAKKMLEWIDKYKVLEKRLELSTKEEGDMKVALEQKEKALSEAKDVKNNLTLANDSLKIEMENLRRGLTTMSQEKVKQIEDQLVKKSKDLSDLRLEMDNLKITYANATKENEEERKQSEGKINSLKLKLKVEMEAREALQLDQQNQNSLVLSLKKELERTNADFDQEKKFLVARLEQLQQEQSQKGIQLSELQSQNLRLQNENENLQQTQERHKQDSMKEKRAMEEKQQHLRNDLAEQSQEVMDMKEQLEQLQKSKAKLVESNQALNVKIEELSLKNVESTQKYEALVHSKEEEVMALSLAKQQLATVSEEAKKDSEESMMQFAKEKVRWEKQVNELNSELNEKNAIVEQTRKTAHSREEELRSWRQKYKSLLDQLEEANPRVEIASFGNRLKQLENEVSEKSQYISKLELENQQFQSRLKSTSQELSSLNTNYSREKKDFERELKQLKFTVTERTEVTSMLESRLGQVNTISRARMQELEEVKEELKSEKQKSQELNAKLLKEMNKAMQNTPNEIQMENEKLKNSLQLSRLREEFDAERQKIEEEIQHKDEQLSSVTQKFEQLTLTHLQQTTKLQQQVDKVTFDSEHEKILMEKKIKQLESNLEEKISELQFMQQASHKLTSKQGDSSQLIEDMKTALEQEKKNHQIWREKFHAARAEHDKTIKETRDAYVQTMQEQREESLHTIEDLREKLRAAQQAALTITTPPAVPVPPLTPFAAPKIDIEVLPLPLDDNTSIMALSPRSIQTAAERSRNKKQNILSPRDRTPEMRTTKKEKKRPDRERLASQQPRAISGSRRMTQSRRAAESEEEIEQQQGTLNEPATPPSPPSFSPQPQPQLMESTSPGDDRNVSKYLKKGSFFRKNSNSRTKSNTTATTPPSISQPLNVIPVVVGGGNAALSPRDGPYNRRSKIVPPAIEIQLDSSSSSNVSPEKTIAGALSKISPSRMEQFKVFSDAILSVQFLEYLISGTDNIQMVMNGVPTPAFVLLRYISYVKHVDEKFLRSNDLNAIVYSLKDNIYITEKMETLVSYMNVTAVLLTILSFLVSPPVSDYVGMNINYIHVDKIEPTEPNYPRPDTQSKLQLVFAEIYGKSLHKLMKHLHGIVQNFILTCTGGSKELVEVLLKYLQCFQTNCMVPALVQQFFTDVFTFLDATIFNEIILRKDLCTFSSAFQLKMDLEETLQTLSDQGGVTWLGNMESWFCRTRQIINCLTLDKKLLCQPEIRKQVCPDISLGQLKQMCSLYECEEFENAILSEVITTLMGDPEFDLSQSLLVPVCTIRINTHSVHVVEPTDIQNMGFPPDLITIILQQIDKYQHHNNNDDNNL